MFIMPICTSNFEVVRISLLHYFNQVLNATYHILCQIQLEWSDKDFPALLERLRGAAEQVSDLKEVN